jgi:hypothetical protein
MKYVVLCTVMLCLLMYMDIMSSMRCKVTKFVFKKVSILICIHFVEFEVATMVTMNSSISYDITPYGHMKVNQHFGWMHCLHLAACFFIVVYVWNYKVDMTLASLTVGPWISFYGNTLKKYITLVQEVFLTWH